MWPLGGMLFSRNIKLCSGDCASCCMQIDNAWCTAKKTNEWVLNKDEVKRKLLDPVKPRKLACHGHIILFIINVTKGDWHHLHVVRKQGSCWRKRYCKEQCQVHAGEEDHAWPGWTTSRREQDSPWKSQSEWERTEIEKVRPWSGQPSDRGRLKNRTEQSVNKSKFEIVLFLVLVDQVRLWYRADIAEVCVQ